MMRGYNSLWGGMLISFIYMKLFSRNVAGDDVMFALSIFRFFVEKKQNNFQSLRFKKFE